VLLLIAMASGMRATVHWETVLGYLNATPFGAVDPLFGYDLSFFVFVLPLWRLVHGRRSRWSPRRSSSPGRLRAPAQSRADEPRPAAGGRRPLAPARPRRRGARAQSDRVLARPVRAGLLAPRYRVRRRVHDVYASLPVLGALAVFAALCAVGCLAQIARSGLRLVAGGLIALALVWVVGLGIYPALLQRFRVTPTSSPPSGPSSDTTSA